VALAEAIPDIQHRALRDAGLRRVSAEDLPIRRTGSPGSFRYSADNETVSRAGLARIKALVIPPAWVEVRIARDPQAHLQAIGRDEAGRLQYIYHTAWEDVRSEIKRHRILQLGKCLGRIRATVAAELGARSANWPLAAAVRLIDILHLRAGHEGYAGDEGGRGVATLLKRHLKFDSDGVRLRFRGKGGKLIDKSCGDSDLCSALKDLYDIRGARLFKIKSENGYRPITASMLNQYLAGIAGKPVSAKDFRTFYASGKALELLSRESAPSAAAMKRSIAAAARHISEDLANTPAIVRKSYIHVSVLRAFEASSFKGEIRSRKRRGLDKGESALTRFLENASTAVGRD
jgi:DNA topoisomerase I